MATIHLTAHLIKVGPSFTGVPKAQIACQSLLWYVFIYTSSSMLGLLTTFHAVVVLSPMTSEKSHHGKVFITFYTISQLFWHACHDCVTFKPPTLFKHPLMLVKRVRVKISEELLLLHVLSSLQMQLHGSLTLFLLHNTLTAFSSTFFTFNNTVFQLVFNQKLEPVWEPTLGKRAI